MRAVVKRVDDIDGPSYAVIISKMTGRIYKDGKKDGKFIDTIGEPDNRYQVYGDIGFPIHQKVYKDKEEIKKDYVIDAPNSVAEAIHFFNG
jgi:hypothetical protein